MNASTHRGEPQSPHRIAGILTASIIAAFLPPYMASSLNVALPTIGREFSIPAVDMSWMITSYLLAIAVTILPLGKAGDLYGRRLVFVWGGLLYTVSTLIAGFMPSAVSFLLVRIVQGVGASMIFATGSALLVAAVPPARRGAMLGINVACTYFGLAAGPTIGGLLTQYLGWRSIFFTGAPLGLLGVVVALWKIGRDPVEAHGNHFDIAGTLLYAVALSTIILGLPETTTAKGRILCGAGLSIMALFVIVEARRTFPLVHIDLFRRNTVFAFSGLAALLNYSATHGTGFLLSLYLQYIKGMTPRDAGIVLVSWPLLMALFSPLAGRLSDRVEPRIVASAGMGLTAAGLFYFGTISAATPLSGIIAGLVALGTGIAFFSSPNASAIMGSVDRADYGMATSIVGTMRLIGQMLSMAMVALVMNAAIGNKVITNAQFPAFIGSARTCFGLFGVLCLLGVFASLARGRMRAKPEHRSPGSPEITVE